MINLGIIEGRMAKDPEIRATESGKTNAKFTVAVDRDYKNKDGEREADFIRCVAWGKTAEIVEKHFTKGKGIIVTGSYRTGTYTNNDGVKVFTTELYADKVGFPVLPPKGAEQTHSEEEQAVFPGFEKIEDDIPF